jgi:pilus assembly protein CpaB
MASMKNPNADSPENHAVRRNRLRAILFFVLAVVAGSAGLFIFTQYINKIKKTLPAGSDTTQPVIVAAMDIPIATRLESRHVIVVGWPKQNVPEGSHGNLKDVVGRTVRQAMVKDEPILDKRLADSKQGQGIAALLDPGLRAMAVEVDSVVGVAGFVQPGDFVDVITTMSPDEETKKTLNSEADRISRIILQNIKVLAVGEHLSTEGREPVKVKVVTLAVSAQQSEQLALGSQYGRILLTIRPRVDTRVTQTTGISPKRLLAPDAGTTVAPPQETETTSHHSSEHRRRAEKTEGALPTLAPPPGAPTVEIIRGNRVEERKLH